MITSSVPGSVLRRVCVVAPASVGIVELSGGSLVLLSLFFRLAVEEHVHHDAPRGRARDGATETEDLACEEPVKNTERVLALVVAWDSNVNVLERRVRVAEGDDGDVDVCRLLHSLVVGARVRDNDQTGLLEATGDVVGERAGREATADCLGAWRDFGKCSVKQKKKEKQI